MTTSNENLDPRSLPNLSNLLTHSAHKRNNKGTANKGPLTSPGLKESFLHNVTIHHRSTLEHDVELPIPALPSSQSIVVNPNKVTEETRLPISPPPEEEIRIKQLGTHGIISKEPNSRLPVWSRPGAFKVPGLTQSSAHFWQQASQPATGRSGQGSVPIPLVPQNASIASKPNPRKRTRHVLPSPVLYGDSKSMPADLTSSSQSSTIISSPNPRARKQPKKHDAGIYTGSGFKRRHKRGTSAESFDDGHIMSPTSANLKSPARKKRHDLGLVDYTPERERALRSTSREPPTKRKLRARGTSTPDVHYEPPTEQFTPPRDVVLQIPSSIISSRSRNTKLSVSTEAESRIDRKVIKVKPERLTSPFPLPPLDLSKPVPPPSPTDDPLLLVGPLVFVRRSATPAVVPSKARVDVSVGDDDISQGGPSTPAHVSPTSARNVDESLWNFGPDLVDETALMDVAFDGLSTFDTACHSGGSDASDGISHDAAHNRPHSASASVEFDPDQSTGSHIFHSDENEVAGEDEGEFTGRFKFYSVPVKQDPPSSATRARRETWGRPISPFPLAKRSNRPPSPEEPQNRQVLLDEDSPPPSPSVGRRRSVFLTQELDATPPALKAQARVTRSRGFTLSEMEVRLESRIAERKARVPLSQPDPEDVSPDMQNREGSLSDDDEDAGSVEREITPVDDHESSTSNDSGQTPAPSLKDLGQSIETSRDQQAYFETSPFKASQSTDTFVSLCGESGGDTSELKVARDGDSFYNKDVPGVVEVSSDDPKAAARAAAILKLHHSYIVDGDVAQRARSRSSPGFLRRSSFSFGDRNTDGDHDKELIRRARRKSTAALAGVMQHRPRQLIPSPLIRSTPIAPGSLPLPTISPEDALREAETEIRAASASPGRPRTPLRSISLVTQPIGHCAVTPPYFGMNYRPHIQEPPNRTGSVKEWTKAHWKTLDICFTDERLAVGSAIGLNNRLAEVDDIDIATVVKRFLAQMEDNEDWDLDMLLRRAIALSSRQRAGRGAPPSPGRLAFQNAAPEFVDPLLTPPAISRALRLETETEVPTKLPPSLLAPRYAHLHEEVTTAPSIPPEIPTLASRPSTVRSLPPPEMRRMKQGPFNTPAKKPISKSQPPCKPSQFPKAKSAKEMVHLNHVEPPQSVQRPRTVSGPIIIPGRTRKDSGGSVKDLIKSFEAVQKNMEEEMKRSHSGLGVRKVASAGNFYARPLWKP